MVMNLSQLALGQEAIIQSIDDQDVYLKLLDLGCLPGELIRLEFIAPFGDPLAIQVAGSTLSLRKSDAQTIQIRPI
jgi:ferrous iron transport protein A